MTTILAIDPGSTKSAWLGYRDGSPVLIGFTPADAPMAAFGISDNDELLQSLRVGGLPNGLLGLGDVVVIEKIESYGMAVGAEVFATVHWAGRFTEAAHPTRVEQLPRRAVKLNLCGSAKAKDANIRQALIDRFGGPTSIRKGGPLYGVSKDVWSALGLAVAYSEGAR